jgi:hypothetical protein
MVRPMSPQCISSATPPPLPRVRPRRTHLLPCTATNINAPCVPRRPELRSQRVTTTITPKALIRSRWLNDPGFKTVVDPVASSYPFPNPPHASMDYEDDALHDDEDYNPLGDAWPWDMSPFHTVSLTQFTMAGMQLWRQNPDWSELVRFIMAGRVSAEDLARPLKTRPIRVNTYLDVQRNLGDEADYIVSRDYDSLIGFSGTLPVTRSIGVYPVPPLRESLTRDNHVEVTISVRGVDTLVRPHLIPNFCTAKLGNRGKIIVLLPALYRPHQSADERKIPQETFAAWYNLVLRPAYRLVAPEQVTHWDVNYQAAWIRQRNVRNRQQTFGTYDVAGPLVTLFGDTLRWQAEQTRIPAFVDFVFMIELRGTKGETVHALNPAQSMTALRHYVRDISANSLLTDPWHIDVGVEISRPDHVVHLFDQAHEDVVKHIFPGVPDELADRFVDSEKFYTDYPAQVYDLAGFRAEPFKERRFDGSTYIQGYPTTKTPSYALHPNAFSFHQPSCILPQNYAALVRDLDDMNTACRAAAANPNLPHDADDNRADGAFRIEVRVPYAKALDTLTRMPWARYSQWICPFPSQVWW